MPSAKTPGFRGRGITITVSSPSLEANSGNPAYGFSVRLKGNFPAALDRTHINIAARLTARAKENLGSGILRKAEQGNRPQSRLTGALFGGHGRKAAVRGEALNKGRGFSVSGKKAGKGVGWPVLIDLERRARHWRSLEFGAPYVTMPQGVFVFNGEAQVPSARTQGHTFMQLGEFYRSKGLRGGLAPRGKKRRQIRKRRIGGGSFVVGRERRGGPIEAKFFLTDAWEEIVGRNGEGVAKEYQVVIREVFSDFQAGR